jgi:ketosteroid isomerase-like protein
MKNEMHATLERYFTATNNHDVDGMTADLADDAVVKDDGREHHGVPAIREWTKEILRKYKPQVVPTKVAREADRTAVSVNTSGDFPGSPIALTYRFKLDGDKISHLEIS